jgi:hypothetical protein
MRSILLDPHPPSLRLNRWSVLAVIAAIGGSAATIAPRVMRDRTTAIAEAKAWDIIGAACPQFPASDVRKQPTATRGFGYAGAGFTYAYGHVACAELRADGGRSWFRGHPVCQFTSPAVVGVHFGGATTYFAPGLGQRATVSIEDGRPRCVMAAKFYGQVSF